MEICPTCGRVRIHPSMRMMRKKDGKNFEETWARLFEPHVSRSIAKRSDPPKYEIAFCYEERLCPECEKKENNGG